MKKKEKDRIKLIILIAIIVSIVLFFVIWSLPSNRVNRCLNSASACFQNQQYPAAMDYYRSATLIDPYRTDAYLGEIQTCLAMGDYTTLETCYETALNSIEGISPTRLNKELENVVWLYSFSLDLYPDDPAKAIHALNRGVALTNSTYLIQLIGDNAVTIEELVSQNSLFYSYIQSILSQQTQAINGGNSFSSFSVTEEQLLYFTLMANYDYISDTDLVALFDSGKIQRDAFIIYDNYMATLLALQLSNMNYIHSVGLSYDSSLIIDYSKAFLNDNDIQHSEASKQAYYQSFETVEQEWNAGNYSVSYQSISDNKTCSGMVLKQVYGFSSITKKLMIFLLSDAGNMDIDSTDSKSLLPYLEETLMTEKGLMINKLLERIE